VIRFAAIRRGETQFAVHSPLYGPAFADQVVMAGAGRSCSLGGEARLTTGGHPSHMDTLRKPVYSAGP
jgi:hypothetical protein